MIMYQITLCTYVTEDVPHNPEKEKAAKSSDITNVNLMRKQWEAGKQVQ